MSKTADRNHSHFRTVSVPGHLGAPGPRDSCLFMNQFFWPDSAATSQLLTDLAGHVAAAGHAVRVVCADDRYAADAGAPAPPVGIHRCANLPFARGRLGRVASYASFLGLAAFGAFRGSRPETVLTLTTPPALALLGSLLRATRGARHFIWEMDLYPDIAVDLGVLSPSAPFTRSLSWALDAARRRAQGIIALGEEMQDSLVAHGIPREKISVCENWADGREIVPHPFPDGPLTVLYSGNLGLAHDIATIRSAMDGLRNAPPAPERNEPTVRFLFSGAGTLRPGLEAFCAARSLRNVEFRPYCTRVELGSSLAEGHIGLVTQLPQTLGAIVPSKTYGIMAAGRPILFIGPSAATPARIIRRFSCGWHIEPGDVRGCIELLCHLAAHPETVQAAGANARAAFNRYYDRPIGVARVAAALGLSQYETNLIPFPDSSG
jgi:colanic acid biosynthesis glycosyl transferase WcaI